MTDTRTQIAETLFRPAPGGYVYRASYRWPFGNAPHYLVNADQKAALLAVILPKRPILWQVVLWSMFCLLVAISCVGLWLYTGHDTPTTLDIIAIFILTVVQVILALAFLFWWKRRRLRPLLATLNPTDLCITRIETRATATNALSAKRLMIAGVASVFSATASLINAAIQLTWRQPVGFLWLLSSLIFAGLAWYYFRQLVSRAENPRKQA